VQGFCKTLYPTVNIMLGFSGVDIVIQGTYMSSAVSRNFHVLKTESFVCIPVHSIIVWSVY